jgi:very-short-patch-repair endonuclease
MKTKLPFHHDSPPGIFGRAKVLRKKSTPAEELLWKMVRNRRMLGLKFRRQHPLQYFVVDFYCHEPRLVLEVDGSIHQLEMVKQHDMERENTIRDMGLTVLRFTNDEVFSQPEKIEMEIKHHLQRIKKA